MNDNLKAHFTEIDKDLDHTWIDLSNRVRDLAAGLKLKAAGTIMAPDADHLSQEVSQLCDHVERVHADVIDLLTNLESRLPFTDGNISEGGRPRDVECSEVQKESIQIQREQHRNSSIKEVIKALFLYVDDPVERVRQKR